MGNISTVNAPNGNSTAYEYDNFARITKLTENIDGQNFVNSYEYDNFGNLTKAIYPSGYTVQKNYDNNGYLTQASGPQGTIFTSDEMNALNQYTKYTLGNGIETGSTYDNFGRPSFTFSGSSLPDAVQYIGNLWSNTTGNLTIREDILKSKADVFNYDALNRLTNYADFFNLNFPLSVGYANNGNITSKTDAGNYTYDPGKPHAVQSVTDPLGLMPLTQNITYTPFKRPATITEGDFELTLTYGPDNQRKKSALTQLGTPVRTITYAGNYEKIETATDIYEVHYITAGPGLVAINVLQNGVADNLFYVYTDHLGSILTLTDATGNVVYEQNFDPWGRERNPNDWTYTPNPNTRPPWLIRGFTGHEHHNEVSLINMNARLYDPIVARMLSPDNFVQDATSTQGFNRYSYVLNNPLIYNDPDGEFIQYIIGAIIGGISGYSIADAYGYKGWDKFWYTLGGAAIGAATAGIGTAATSSAGIVAGGVAGGAVSGAGFGTMSGYASGLRGGDLFSAGITGMFRGAIAGGAGSIVGGAIGGGWGALAGGATSNLTGQLLANDFSFQDVNWTSVGVSGATSLGIYHLSSYVNWRSNVKNQNFYGRSIKYGQYLKMQASYTRGKFWGSEKAGGGFWLTEKGISRQGVSYDAERGNVVRFDYSQKPEGAWATFHPHPYNESQVVGGNLWHSPQDLSNVGSTNFSSTVINKHGAELITPVSAHYINFWPSGKPYYIYYYPW